MNIVMCHTWDERPVPLFQLRRRIHLHINWCEKGLFLKGDVLGSTKYIYVLTFELWSLLE